ncbi:hypothetical protein [Nocardia rhizosphaerihabitans]|uniref:hypothetical protein n=1 Tax=Nocardia rhizosphaerihabitans TaxID=1691570 RepID=UPI00166B4579|nr:hypothetical protein [Nocardia rhizosphaerihabitans]
MAERMTKVLHDVEASESIGLQHLSADENRYLTISSQQNQSAVTPRTRRIRLIGESM